MELNTMWSGSITAAPSQDRRHLSLDRSISILHPVPYPGSKIELLRRIRGGNKGLTARSLYFRTCSYGFTQHFYAFQGKAGLVAFSGETCIRR